MNPAINSIYERESRFNISSQQISSCSSLFIKAHHPSSIYTPLIYLLTASLIIISDSCPIS